VTKKEEKAKMIISSKIL